LLNTFSKKGGKKSLIDVVSFPFLLDNWTLVSFGVDFVGVIASHLFYFDLICV